MEIGDKFVIKYKRKNKCLFPNKEFRIKGFSKSKLSIFYDDLRTNIKCKCSICSNASANICLSIENITITISRLNEIRDKKLKILLKK